MSRMRQRGQQQAQQIERRRQVQFQAQASVVAASDAAVAQEAVAAIDADGINTTLQQLRDDVDALQAGP